MFRVHRPQAAPDEIYASSLATFHEGHALWYPEPHESGEPQIGDVGFVRKGAFIRLFNLDTSVSENKVTFWDPPFEIAEPLPPGVLKIDRRRRPLAPGHYCSHGVEATGVYASADVTTGMGVSAALSASYTCKTAQGAALAFKSEAHAEAIFENRVLEKYIIRNHDSWYAYARNVLGHRVKREDLIVVIGWVKTEADWAASAFSNVSTSSSGSLKGRAGSAAGAAVGRSHSNSVTGPRMHRHGEHYSGITPRAVGEKKDQSIFLKRYKVLVRLILPNKVVAGAGYHRFPDADDAGDGSGEERVVVREEDNLDEVNMPKLEDEDKIPDPLDVLLDYILETSNVETAIACDDDVESIIGANHVIDFASYLRRVQPPVKVDGTLGSLCTEDLISHEQDRAFVCRTITASDLAQWPKITSEDRARLQDGYVFIGGPMEADARPVKFKHLVFDDSRSPSHFCPCLASSTDGKLLAASLYTNDVLVWRLSDGLLVQRLHHQGHTSPINSLSFSPNGRNLVSGSVDTSAIIWDVRSGRVLQRLEAHSNSVVEVAYAPNGVLVATASDHDASVKIWDASTGTCLQSLSIDAGISNLIFSPEGLYLYIELGRSCLIYDTQTYTRIATLQHDPETPLYSSLSHQGDRAVTASDDQLKIWNTVTGEELLVINHPKELSGPVAFSPDGTEVLASCREDKAAVTYDSRTGQLRRVFALSDEACCAAYSPNGDYLVLGDDSGELRVIDAKSGAFLAKLETDNEPGVAQFLPDSQGFSVCFWNGPPMLCNVRDMMRMR